MAKVNAEARMVTKRSMCDNVQPPLLEQGLSRQHLGKQAMPFNDLYTQSGFRSA
jgi:hypothetical protein